MLFNSMEFLFFFPVVVLLYYVLPKKFKWVWLLITSYYFYMCWSVAYSLLLMLTTFTTYLTARILGKAKKYEKKKQRFYKIGCVLAGVSVNLGILAVFKYGNFIIDNINHVTGKGIASLSLVPPVGISFYTFQSIGYIIDVYRGDIEPERNLGKYALFLSFFPQLVAGPIERSSNLLSQLFEEHKFDYDKARSGMLLIAWGLFQKIVISDRAAILVNTVFVNYQAYYGAQLMFAAVCFAVQIYCDFGGYTYIAIGAAKILGIDLMENFKHPYFAMSIREFWSRWHISLSTWFRDYVYIPLGGNRCSKWRKNCNVMLTMLLSGLWHGAGFNYIVWGGIHGLYQIVGDATKNVRKVIISEKLNVNTETAAYKIFQGLVTFCLVDFALIFFRSESVGNAVQFITRMFTTFDIRMLLNENLYTMGLDYKEMYLLILLMLFLALVSAIQQKAVIGEWLLRQNLVFRWGMYLCSVFVILLYGIYGNDYQQTQFIYFQF